MNRRSRALLGAAALTIAGLVIASCGSSTAADNSASTSSESQTHEATSAESAQSDTGESSSAAKPTMSLKIGQISNSVAFFPIFVARDMGYFADEGLEVNDPPLLGTGAKLAAALVSGSIDVGGGVMTDAFNAVNANQNVQVIANLVNEYYVDIIVGKDTKVAPEDASLIDKIKSLKGLKIGITGPGSGNEALVSYLFNMAGMNAQTDSTLVNLGAQATAVVGALKTGQVDALSFFQPIPQEVVAQGLGSIYISPARGDVPDMAGQTHGVAMASADALANKKDALVAYTKAIAKAEEFIAGDEAKVEEELAKYEGNLDAATVKALVPTLRNEIPKTPEVTEQGFDIAVQFHEKAGLVKNPPAFDKVIASGIISEALGK